MDDIREVSNESRAEYIMRVASAFIERNCPDGTIRYDGTECNGYCLAADLEIERLQMKGSDEQVG